MEWIFTSRCLLLGASAALFGADLAAFAILERPGLGIAHLFYLPVVLLALAAGPRIGVLAGLLATALFVLGTALNPRIGIDVETPARVAIRLGMYVAAGVVTGTFAQTMRRLVARLEALAERDHLTGLFNDRAFEEALRDRLELAEPFALLLCDLDDLKAINDTHGHQAGSDAIRRLGATLSGLVREDDHLSRIGGDELALLCGAAGEAQARAFAERLGGSVGASGARVSFGWAVFPADARDAISLYRVADERLYAEKARRKGTSALAIAERRPLDGRGRPPQGQASFSRTS